MSHYETECPECGSNDITVYENADEYTCNDCGHGWAGYELLPE